MCCSAEGAICYSNVLAIVLLATFSRKQSFEAAVFPFDQGRGWLQLLLNSSCAARSFFDSLCLGIILFM